MQKQFKVSAYLKNIIGKELITDDLVAIFELVKNAFDANATRVDVDFYHVGEKINKIVIRDNGKGMDRVDIDNKWLFVAYSAKKEGTENFRDKQSMRRFHAGAKGIGRFSCDRLGSALTIYTRRSKSSKFSKLIVDWGKFEKNMKKRFEKLNLDYSEVSSCPYSLRTGTVLEITKVRSDWDKEKFKRLRASLEKLINPLQGNDADAFEIHLNVPKFKSEDARAKKSDELSINGRINNFIFEKLELKTTYIAVDISEDGERLTTELFDRGADVYRLVEDNPYKTDKYKLSNIRIYLFALNQSAKNIFSRHMGISVVDFGSVFVYKNGFRIHPIGEIGKGDVFSLDRRKQQGHARYFGTRDLIGRIEINGGNDELKEVSSRDGGLERTEAFFFLEKCFIESALRRLERYAINLVKFGSYEDFDPKKLPQHFRKDKALALIHSIAGGKSVRDISYNPHIFDVLSDSSSTSLRALLTNLEKIAAETTEGGLGKEIRRIRRRINEIEKAVEEAERQAETERTGRERAEQKTAIETEKANKASEVAKSSEQAKEIAVKESVFLRSLVSSDLENVMSLHHHIGHAAGKIEDYIRNFSRKIKQGKPLTIESFQEVLGEISLMARQIRTTANFATKANFNLDAESVRENLSDFIVQYITNVCQGIHTTSGGLKEVKFEIAEVPNEEFVTKFRPLEITMIMDNLISNSTKAKADSISFISRIDCGSLVIDIKDNGKGVKRNEDRLFELGFSSTNGSGLGLYHVKKVLTCMGGTIENVPSDRGATFRIVFPGDSA